MNADLKSGFKSVFIRVNLGPGFVVMLSGVKTKDVLSLA
jgi:hypothetical protein